jgi:hypothetical protein
VQPATLVDSVLALLDPVLALIHPLGAVRLPRVAARVSNRLEVAAIGLSGRLTGGTRPLLLARLLLLDALGAVERLLLLDALGAVERLLLRLRLLLNLRRDTLLANRLALFARLLPLLVVRLLARCPGSLALGALGLRIGERGCGRGARQKGC